MGKNYIHNTPLQRGGVNYNTRTLNSFEKNFGDMSTENSMENTLDKLKIQSRLRKYKTTTNFNTNNVSEIKNRTNIHFKLINNENRNDPIENNNLANKSKQIKYARNKYVNNMDEKLTYSSLPNDNIFKIGERKTTKSSGQLLNNFYNNHSITEINNLNNQTVGDRNIKTYRKIVNSNLSNKINSAYNARKDRNTFNSNMNDGVNIDGDNFEYQDY